MSVIAALVLLMTVGSGASAAPPDGLESYQAGADASALDLQVGLLDLQIAAGLTESGVTSDGPAATGDGTAILLAGTENGVAGSAAPDGAPSADACAVDESLPAPLDILDLSLACVHSTASVTDGSPASTANSDSLVLPIGGGELTEQLLGALLPITDQVTAVLGDVLEQLNTVTCALPIGDLLALLDPLLPGISEGVANLLCSLGDVTSVVDALIGSLADAVSTTLTITLAPNSTLTGASDEGVIAAAVAEGATIDVLPGIGPNGTSFIEIIVGSSEASVVRDATTGEATAEANPSVVEVNVNGIGLAGLDIGLGDVLDPVLTFVNDLVNTLATASPLACGEPGPLAEIVCLDAAAGFTLNAEEAAAEGYDFGPGTVGARTSALRLELLSILNGGEPAVSLSLAEATAAANATPVGAPAPPPPDEDTPVTITRLPKTGSTSDFGAVAVALALGLGALAIGMRRRSAH